MTLPLTKMIQHIIDRFYFDELKRYNTEFMQIAKVYLKSKNASRILFDIRPP